MHFREPYRLVIADDHEFFRNGFKNIIQSQYPNEVNFIADVSNGEKLVEAVAYYQPDIVFTDIQMPSMDGIEACKKIKANHPATVVIACSMFTDLNQIKNMIQAGADGYLAKTSSHEEVIDAVRTVKQQRPYYCSTISEKLYTVVANSNQKNRLAKTIFLGEQEKKLIRLLCRELSTKEIAAEMKLATRTVENYRQNIQEKIGARNVVGIVLYALVHEIVKFSDIKK